MKLHKNWSVTEDYLQELKALPKGKLMKLIEGKNLFGGLYIGHVTQGNKKIYNVIKSFKAKRKSK